MSEARLHAWWLRCALALGALVAGCSPAVKLEADIGRVQRRLEQVLAGGAYFCAPRELALARAQLEFARNEHAQGDLAEARGHVASSELNLRAAERLSPAARCAGSAAATPEHQTMFGDDQPDADLDGVPDDADGCARTPEDMDGYMDTDGCPDADNDLDGIADTIDQCPFQAEDVDGQQDSDGCPDPDSDGDGVSDTEDRCPTEAGGAANQGCPRVRYKGVELTASALRITESIAFDEGTATMRSVSFPLLDTIVDVLKDHPQISLEVQAHTDSQGDEPANLELTQARAETVVRYLVQHGIEPSRLTAKGYGETRPIESNRTSQGREVNRRVELIRTDKQQ